MSISLKGPKALPIIGNLHQLNISNLHNDIGRLSEEYGPIFKIALGPSKMIAITDPAMIQQILRARPTDYIRMKKMDKILRAEGVDGVFNAEGESWKVHRRIISKGLDVKHLQHFYPSIHKTTERFYNKLVKASNSTEPYSIQEDLLRYTVDVTTSLAFGIEMNTLEQEGGVIQEHMEKIFPVIFKRINLPIPFYKIYRTKTDKEFDKAIEVIDELVGEFIEAGRKRIEENPLLKENPENLLDAILVAAEEENAFTNDEIKGNLLTLLMAGEDTTAHSLAWCIYFLVQHPEIQEKMYEESCAVLGDSTLMEKYEDHSKMTYIEGVINETLRLKPVAPVLLVDAEKDVRVGEYDFPKGTKFFLQTKAGGQNDSYFSEPTKFMPERWMKQISKCPVHNIEGFMPFGSGPRFCPGKNLAILEMKVVLSMLAKNFKIEIETPIEDVTEIMAFTMVPTQYKVKLIARK
jgi:cytochrome P450